MEQLKELDCLLVEARSDEGYLLKFTIRGKDATEVHSKWEDYRVQFFPGLTPNTTQQVQQTPANGQTVSNLGASSGLSSALGSCPKCGAPNKISKQGKKYCSNTCWLK